MPLSPEQIAHELLKRCFQRRDVATEIAEIRAAETFAFWPDTNIWRDIHKGLAQET